MQLWTASAASPHDAAHRETIYHKQLAYLHLCHIHDTAHCVYCDTIRLCTARLACTVAGQLTLFCFERQRLSPAGATCC